MNGKISTVLQGVAVLLLASLVFGAISFSKDLSSLQAGMTFLTERVNASIQNDSVVHGDYEQRLRTLEYRGIVR